MIRITPPDGTPTRANPLRIWVCVFCTAGGRASSEESQRQLTRARIWPSAARPGGTTRAWTGRGRRSRRPNEA